MKKVALVISMFALVTLYSCKKDWTCTCVITETVGTYVNTTSDDFGISNESKSDAKDECNQDDSNLTDSTGVNIVTACEIN